MGQLEKYGLYVLCLVIFLILGVTIWGDGGVPPNRGATPTGLNASTSTAGAPRGNDASPRGPAAAPNLHVLLQPATRPVPPARDAGPVDAGANAGVGGTLNASAGNSPGPVVAKPPVGAEPAAKPPVAVVRPTHKVASGDSFDSIAEAKLGNASLRTEIARLNPGVDPRRLQVGHVLTLPSAADLASSSAPAVDPSRDAGAARAAGVAYTIGKGDTFEGIARRQLGDIKRVSELRELNPDVEPTRLRIGQKIRLPKK